MVDQATERLAVENESLKTRIAELEESLDETRRTANDAYYPVKDASQRVVAVSTEVRDVTEHKIAERALVESEQRLKTLVDFAPEAIVVVDGETGKFVDVNKNAERLFGLDGDAMLQVGPVDLSPTYQADGRTSVEVAREFIAEALAGGAPVFAWNHINSDGEVVPCEVRLVNYPTSGRKLVRGSVWDITDRLQAQEALKRAHNELEAKVEERAAALAKSEERWRSVVETAPELILIINPDGTIRYANRSVQGFDRFDVVGTSVYDYVHPSHRDEIIEATEATLRTGEFQINEALVPGADGSIEWYSSRIGPLREGGEIVGVINIAMNITEIKKAEKQLKANDLLQRNLLEVQERDRKMIASELHDGLLQYVIGAHLHLEALGAALERGERPPSSEIRCIDDHLQRAMQEGRRMIGEVRPMIIDEGGVVDAIAHLVADDSTTSQLSVAFQHDVTFDRLDPMLESALYRIVQESLNNVRRHAQTDRADVRITEQDGQVRVEVEDHGVGFDPRAVPSTRFGLRSIRERTRLFGGSTSVTSSPGKGTRIIAELPVIAAS